MEYEKETDPTMDRPSKEGKGTEDELYRHYMNLQQEWDSIKQHRQRTLLRASTDSRIMVKARQLLNNSPRNLMSSLQYLTSPSEGGGAAWKVRKNELAVQEILNERQAAIESGKLKGRRLFEARENTMSEIGFRQREEMACDDLDSLVQESDVRSMFSYSDDENENVEERQLPTFCCHCCSYSSSTSSSSSFICDDCIERELAAAKDQKNEVAAASVEEKKRVANADREFENGTSWMVSLGCLAVAFLVCAIGIISKRSFAGRGVGDEVILFPT